MNLLAIKLGIYAGAALAIFAAGAYSHYRWTDAEAIKTALQASEQARKEERDNATALIQKLDRYSAAATESKRRALAARSDLERVRDSLATIAAPAPAASCPVDPRLAGIAGLLAEGAGLVEESARHVDELRNQRDALK